MKLIIIIDGDFIDGCVAGDSVRCCFDGGLIRVQLSSIRQHSQAVIIASAQGAI